MSSTALSAYGGRTLNVKGQCEVEVKIGEQERPKLPLIVQ